MTLPCSVHHAGCHHATQLLVGPVPSLLHIPMGQPQLEYQKGERVSWRALGEVQYLQRPC